MATESRKPLPMASAKISMKFPGHAVQFKFDYPTGPATTEDFLPPFRTITDLIVKLSVENAEAAGKTISCKKGCGACCRQIVPVARSEARVIAQYIEELPEPERNEITARFDAAVRRFDEIGLGDKLRNLHSIEESEFHPLSNAYFHERIACPFLVDESCSIHPIRPLGCREFMVTSPAENCSLPTAEKVETVPLPNSTGNAVRRMEGGWTPMVLAMEWVKANPVPDPAQPGEQILRTFLDFLPRS